MDFSHLEATKLDPAQFDLAQLDLAERLGPVTNSGAHDLHPPRTSSTSRSKRPSGRATSFDETPQRRMSKQWGGSFDRFRSVLFYLS